jgi:hypothetical protein
MLLFDYSGTSKPLQYYSHISVQVVYFYYHEFMLHISGMAEGGFQLAILILKLKILLTETLKHN